MLPVGQHRQPALNSRLSSHNNPQETVTEPDLRLLGLSRVRRRHPELGPPRGFLPAVHLAEQPAAPDHLVAIFLPIIRFDLLPVLALGGQGHLHRAELQRHQIAHALLDPLGDHLPPVRQHPHP